MPLPTRSAAIRRLMHQLQLDILHVQVPYSPWLAQRVIQAADEPTAVVGTFHVAPHTRLMRVGTRGLATWTRSSLRRFSTILSVSSAAAEFAKQSYGIATKVLPNVINYGRFHAAEPFSQYKDGTPTILFLGRLVPRKGCLYLLQAISHLVQASSTPVFRVVICGTGPLEPRLKQFVREHQLEQYVEFTGYVSEEDKPRYYASADIAVFPSTGGESFGIVLLEAMASGQAAVLAGDNSGYRSVMQPHEELLFDPHDTAVLVEKLRLLLTDTAARRAVAEWGSTYTKSFDVAAVGPQLITLYKQALRSRSNMR